MTRLNEIIAYAGLLVTIAGLAPLYYDWYKRREQQKPHVYLAKFTVGTSWRITVTCVRGNIERCRVFYDGVQLTTGGADADTLVEQKLLTGEEGIYALPGSSINLRDDALVVVKDGKNGTIRREKWKEVRRSESPPQPTARLA